MLLALLLMLQTAYSERPKPFDWDELLCGGKDPSGWYEIMGVEPEPCEPKPRPKSGLLDDLYSDNPVFLYAPPTPTWVPADRKRGWFFNDRIDSFNKANAAARARDFLKAGRLYGGIARTTGGGWDLDALEALALCQIELGHPDQALVNLQLVLKDAPGRLHASAGVTRAKQRIALRAQPVLVLR